jgi:hypothetical protein
MEISAAPVGERPDAESPSLGRPVWDPIEAPVACEALAGHFVARDCRTISDEWLIPDDETHERACG